MERRWRALVGCGICALAVLGCADPTHLAGPPDVGPRADAGAMVDANMDGAVCPTTIDDLQARIFAPSCGIAGCHSAVAPTYGLDLASPGLASRLVGVASRGCVGRTLVVPGDPAASYLIEKLSTDLPQCGLRMPSGSTLDPALVDCIRAWITHLANTDAGPMDAAMYDAGPFDAGVDGGQDAGADGGPCGSTGLVECSSMCVDPSNDSMHCGSCTNACGAGQVCSSGVCTFVFM